jgi:hypothetical protein
VPAAAPWVRKLTLRSAPPLPSLRPPRSCVGVWQNGQVQIIENDSGNRTTPSMVAFTDEERLVGEAARNQAAQNPTNTVFDAKRLIGMRLSGGCCPHVRAVGGGQALLLPAARSRPRRRQAAAPARLAPLATAALPAARPCPPPQIPRSRPTSPTCRSRW